MPAPGSVTSWLDELRKCAARPQREQAAARLGERFGARLVALAGGRLRGAPRRVADEEDVALDAFSSFCRGAGAGRFPQADRREQLVALLAAMVRNKADKLLRRERRQKRGGGAVL